MLHTRDYHDPDQDVLLQSYLAHIRFVLHVKSFTHMDQDHLADKLLS